MEYREREKDAGIKETEGGTGKTDTGFITEKIKQRPINKKKLLRRTVITASMAVIFGLIACLTFTFLEPVISNWLYPEETKTVKLPEVEEETPPEDLIVEDEDEEPQPPSTIVKKVDMEVADYQQLQHKIYALTQEVSRSVVTVTGVVSDVDWLNNTYEDKGQTVGLLAADNGREYLILVDRQTVVEAEDVKVTFYDGTQAPATLKEDDVNTQLAVIAVSREELKKNGQEEEYPVAELGNSNSAYMLGAPVIAIGNPMGTGSKSVSYGMISSVERPISLIDANYKLFTTDIYGSPNATGVIVNLSGQVMGVIDQTYNAADMKNLISALGISELKDTLTRMNNAGPNGYIGIYGMDVTPEANEKLSVPMGAYVTGIAMDSPAMRAGIQSGDVIIRMNAEEINSFKSYEEQLKSLRPDNTVQLAVMRQGPEGYEELSVGVTLGEM